MLVLIALAWGAPLSEAHVAEVAAAGGLDPAVVRARLEGMEPDRTVLDRMAKPWEAKPWHLYRGIFLTDKRIEGGRAFLEAHRETLEKAEATYGVAPEIVVAILGVETSYGTTMGDDTVLDALFTLGFHHPKRGSFFRKELGVYLSLEAEQGWSGVKGSYAGAMGMGQFMPSSYQRYAVDFDGDGKRDLFGSTDDAIGSVASYFAAHGWKGEAHVLVDAQLPASGLPDALVGKGLGLDWTVAQVRDAGVVVDPAIPADARARVVAFGTPSGDEHKLMLNDFYAITRYNHSPLYARAVWELAGAIRDAGTR